MVARLLAIATVLHKVRLCLSLRWWPIAFSVGSPHILGEFPFLLDFFVLVFRFTRYAGALFFLRLRRGWLLRLPQSARLTKFGFLPNTFALRATVRKLITERLLMMRTDRQKALLRRWFGTDIHLKLSLCHPWLPSRLPLLRETTFWSIVCTDCFIWCMWSLMIDSHWVRWIILLFMTRCFIATFLRVIATKDISCMIFLWLRIFLRRLNYLWCQWADVFTTITARG